MRGKKIQNFQSNMKYMKFFDGRNAGLFEQIAYIPRVCCWVRIEPIHQSSQLVLLTNPIYLMSYLSVLHISTFPLLFLGSS